MARAESKFLSAMLASGMAKQEPQPCRRFKHMNITSSISETSSEVLLVQGRHSPSEPRVEYFGLDAQASELTFCPLDFLYSKQLS
jgi:hypothetical protein